MSAPPGRVSLSAFFGRLLIVTTILVLAVVVELAEGGAYTQRELTALWSLVTGGFGLTLVYDYLVKYRGGWGLPALELAGDGVWVLALVYCTGEPVYFTRFCLPGIPVPRTQTLRLRKSEGTEVRRRCLT